MNVSPNTSSPWSTKRQSSVHTASRLQGLLPTNKCQVYTRGGCPRHHRQTTCMAEAAGSSGGSSVTQRTPTPMRLVQLYCEVQHPALSNRPYSKAMLDFVNESVVAFECGWTSADLAQQLEATIAELRNTSNNASLAEQCRTLQRGMSDFAAADFLACVNLVWVTLMLSPSDVKRWARSPAVDDSNMALWEGFVNMIANAYFDKRMTWYPVDRLTLELKAVQGSAPDPDVVAERARMVFTTLEKVCPQFPTM